MRFPCAHVQVRLVAPHVAPWKTAEVERRDGLSLRRGDGNPEVAIYRHVSEGSFAAPRGWSVPRRARRTSIAARSRSPRHSHKKSWPDLPRPSHSRKSSPCSARSLATSHLPARGRGDVRETIV